MYRDPLAGPIDRWTVVAGQEATPATNTTMTIAPAAFREKPMSETPMLFMADECPSDV